MFTFGEIIASATNGCPVYETDDPMWNVSMRQTLRYANSLSGTATDVPLLPTRFASSQIYRVYWSACKRPTQLKHKDIRYKSSVPPSVKTIPSDGAGHFLSLPASKVRASYQVGTALSGGKFGCAPDEFPLAHIHQERFPWFDRDTHHIRVSTVVSLRLEPVFK